MWEGRSERKKKKKKKKKKRVLGQIIQSIAAKFGPWSLGFVCYSHIENFEDLGGNFEAFVGHWTIYLFIHILVKRGQKS